MILHNFVKFLSLHIVCIPVSMFLNFIKFKIIFNIVILGYLGGLAARWFCFINWVHKTKL